MESSISVFNVVKITQEINEFSRKLGQRAFVTKTFTFHTDTGARVEVKLFADRIEQLSISEK